MSSDPATTQLFLTTNLAARTRDGGREGGKEGGREREGGREGRREGGTEGEKRGQREKDGGKDGGGKEVQRGKRERRGRGGRKHIGSHLVSQSLQKISQVSVKQSKTTDIRPCPKPRPPVSRDSRCECYHCTETPTSTVPWDGGPWISLYLTLPGAYAVRIHTIIQYQHHHQTLHNAL